MWRARLRQMDATLLAGNSSLHPLRLASLQTSSNKKRETMLYWPDTCRFPGEVAQLFFAAFISASILSYVASAGNPRCFVYFLAANSARAYEQPRS